MPGDNYEYEKRLIQGCLRGKVKAQKELYENFANKMYAICMRYTGNQDDAKDILQEGFIKVYGNLDRFGFKGSFEGWMRRIFVNTSIEFLRKRTRMGFTEEIEDDKIGGSADQSYNKIEAADIMRYINKLPQGYRMVFNLYVIEGYLHKEIAEMLGISEGTSKSQLNKARNMMQRLLSEYERH